MDTKWIVRALGLRRADIAHVSVISSGELAGFVISAMLPVARAARQLLGRAFGARAQWLKPRPCAAAAAAAAAAHTAGKRWRGDKRLVAFPLH